MGFFAVSPRRKFLLRVVWALLLAFVAACSLLPGDSQAKRVMDAYFNDKLGHAAAYFLLAFLPAIHEAKPVATVQAVVTLGVGFALEAAQRLFTCRAFDAGDVAANTAGVLAALALAARLRARHTAPPSGTRLPTDTGDGN